ncbi:MAG TPA: hypothetical protein ENK28_03465 [Aliiroseovarius sp.]|nr:hypothetical protein [Aliiroseovarius sp.]
MTLDVSGTGRSWCVVTSDGTIVSRHFTCRDYAIMEIERLKQAKKARPRNCLCCGAEFTSEGAHNRMCMDCRKQTEGMI